MMRKALSNLLAAFLLAALILSACQVASPSTQLAPASTTAAPSIPTKAVPPTQPSPAVTNTPSETAAQPTQIPTVAPAQPATAAGSSKPKSINITYDDEPESLNPLYTQNWFAWITWDLFLLPLWSIDNQGKFHPDLAAEIPTLENGGVSKDGLTITVKLRPEATWSDGNPITADDVTFTYDMIMANGNTVASRYPFDQYIKAIKAIDAHTVEINLNEVYADWQTGFFFKDSRVLPRHILKPVFDKDGTLDNAAWNRKPDVGNGPFVVTEWQTGSHMKLVANPKYFGGKPKLDEIYIRIVPDHKAELASLASGDTDLVANMLGSDTPEINKMGDAHLVTAFGGNFESLFLNVSDKTAHPAMTDARVRKAIAMSINRQQIIDKIFYGIYTIPATFWYGTPYDNPDPKPWPYDPAGAKALLDQAGWKVGSDGVREKGGKKLELRYSTSTGSETRDATAVVLQQELADVGIKMDINNYSKDVLFASFANDGPIATGKYDISHWSDGMWYFPSPDTSYFLCDQIPTAAKPDGYNWYGVCDAKLDELFKKQAGTVDPKQRADLFHQIAQIMYDQVYWIPLRIDPDVWAMKDRLLNIQLSGVHPFWNAVEWIVK